VSLSRLATLLALALGLAGPAAASHGVSDQSLRGVVAVPAVVPAGGPHVRVEVMRPDGRPVSGLTVRVEAFHGFLRRSAVALAPEGPGVYAGRVPVHGTEGFWQGVVRVEGGPRPVIGDIAFTVRRDLEADVAATPRALGFRKAGPWTAPPWLDHLVWITVLGGMTVAAGALARRPPPATRPVGRLALRPWVTALGIAGSMTGALGAYWDVAWHVDRGRETFWSPPHLMIYGGILSVSVAILVSVALAEGGAGMALRSHRGLRFTLLAAALTLASAPFDEAWHALFGLDVSIWSPPHLVLLFGSALAMLGVALLYAEGPATRVRGPAVALLAGAALLSLGIFVLEFEFPLLERWHVMMARPRGLYLACATALTLLVLAAAARAGGRGVATGAALVGGLGRVGVSLLFLPALGRTAPLLAPVALVPAVALELALRAAPARWSAPRRFAAGGVVATAVAYLAHNVLAAAIGGRMVPPAELWAWFPIALAAGAAAASLGFRIGTLARPPDREA
jgi:hypothetical protein